MSFYSSAGGIVTTAQDLAVFGEALLSGKLLSEASLSDMDTARKGGYGLGWIVGRSKTGFSGGHNGRTVGFSSYLYVDKTSDTVVVLLADTDIQRTDEIGGNVTQLASKQ